MKHYHVIENTPGYLPDSDEPPYPYTNRRDAERGAQEATDRYREDTWICAGCECYGRDRDEHARAQSTLPLSQRHRFVPLYTIRGNRSDGYTVSDNSKLHDLGRVIYVDECSETECLEDNEQ